MTFTQGCTKAYLPLENMLRIIGAKKKHSRSQAQKEHSIATRSGKRRTVCFISELVIQGNLMAVSRHLHASQNYAADYNLCRMHCCIPPGPTGKSSIQPSYIMLQNPKNEMKVIPQCSYKQPHPQTKSLNNSGGQGHLITVHLFGRGKLTKTARHLNLLGSATSLGSEPFCSLNY